MVLASPRAKPRSFDSVKSAPITDRGLRTKVHQFIRRVFNSRLETATDDDGVIVVTAASAQRGWGASKQSTFPHKGRDGHPVKAKVEWDGLGGPHLHFSLYKENKDTMEIVSRLAYLLRTPTKNLQFAGTKDRRAVTVQRVSVFRVRAEKVAGLNRDLRGAKVGDFEYQPQGLSLGELAGNEFVITLRDCKLAGSTANVVEGQSIDGAVEALKVVIGQGLASLKEKGFINYFGLQRFGSFSARTDTIGLKMLQGDMKGAVDEILAYNEDLLTENRDVSRDRIAADDRARAEGIRLFRMSKTAKEALSVLPHKYSAEANLIRHLGHGSTQERATDYKGALSGIPRNLRSMYGHAYQSLVWNVMAGQRWKLFGDRVVEGDLVLVEEHRDKEAPKAETAQGTAPSNDEVDESGEPIVLPSADDDTAADGEDRFQRARPLTKEEAESGIYTIYDIVLPTPGYDILYPSNVMAERYQTFMASERGGGIDPHNMRRQWREISMSGSYRKLVARPLGESTVDVEVRSYTKDDEQMVQTDLEKLQLAGKAWKAKFDKLEESFAAEDRGSANGNGAQQEKGDGGSNTATNKKIAAVIKFQLGTSQYATMALRELMGPEGVIVFKPDFGGGR